jgi:hypothetical protein
MSDLTVNLQNFNLAQEILNYDMIYYPLRSLIFTYLRN